MIQSYIPRFDQIWRRVGREILGRDEGRREDDVEKEEEYNENENFNDYGKGQENGETMYAICNNITKRIMKARYQ